MPHRAETLEPTLFGNGIRNRSIIQSSCLFAGTLNSGSVDLLRYDLNCAFLGISNGFHRQFWQGIGRRMGVYRA